MAFPIAHPSDGYAGSYKEPRPATFSRTHVRPLGSPSDSIGRLVTPAVHLCCYLWCKVGPYPEMPLTNVEEARLDQVGGPEGRRRGPLGEGAQPRVRRGLGGVLGPRVGRDAQQGQRGIRAVAPLNQGRRTPFGVRALLPPGAAALVLALLQRGVQQERAAGEVAPVLHQRVVPTLPVVDRAPAEGTTHLRA